MTTQTMSVTHCPPFLQLSRFKLHINSQYYNVNAHPSPTGVSEAVYEAPRRPPEVERVGHCTREEQVRDSGGLVRGLQGGVLGQA